MKLVLYDNYRVGILQGNDVVDVTEAVKKLRDHPRGQRMIDIITKWSRYKDTIEAAAKSGPRKPMTEVRFRPPVPKPGKILCLGVNYIESERPDLTPIDAFVKTPSVISGDGDTITLPPLKARTAHAEPELAFVVGKTARRVKAKNAMDYIFGYINLIDFSLRLSRPPDFPTMFAHKGSEGFAPIGPALVTADEISDPYNLTIKHTVNGNTTSYHTRTMGHRLPKTIEWLSMVCTLYPGDIISMGTNHEALQPVMHGDEVSIQVEGLGPAVHVKVKDWLRSRRFERSAH
jgi:2-keto-4-pentenoate hydratase/2-oxohepta-3-ene-1,7-dioic acid hydratase in catechol pathway